MKSILFMLLSLGLGIMGFSQTTTICVGTGVTTTLVFESDVKHVDLGSRSLLAQQVKEAPKVVLVKAGQRDFAATNLSVVTADGKVYAFRVEFDSEPKQWIYSVPLTGKPSLTAYAESILGNAGYVRGTKDHRSALRGLIKGIYVKDGHLFFHLELSNETAIPFAVDFIRYSIRDLKKARRTASQETEVAPLTVVGGASQIPARGKMEVVYAFESFTLPDAKYLHIEMAEKGGGRHLSFRLKNRMILSARALPDLK